VGVGGLAPRVHFKPFFPLYGLEHKGYGLVLPIPLVCCSSTSLDVRYFTENVTLMASGLFPKKPGYFIFTLEPSHKRKRTDEGTFSNSSFSDLPPPPVPPMASAEEPMEGVAPQKKLTAKDMDRAAWAEYNAFKADMSRIRRENLGADGKMRSAGAEAVFLRCCEILEKHNPGLYKLMPRGKKELLRYCAKRLSVDAVLKTGFITTYKDAWASIVARLKSKYKSYKSYKTRYAYKGNKFVYRRMKPWMYTSKRAKSYYFYRRNRKPGQNVYNGRRNTYYAKRRRNW